MSRHFSASDEHAEACYGAQLIVTMSTEQLYAAYTDIMNRREMVRVETLQYRDELTVLHGSSETRFRPGMLQHVAQQVVSSMARETRLGEVLDHLAQELVVRDPLNFIIRSLL